MFSIFILYSGILLLAGSNINYDFFKQNKIPQLKSDHDCVMSDRICIFYRYKFEENLMINVSLHPGKVYIPLELLSIYDPMVSIFESIPRTQQQLDKYNELLNLIKIAYEDNWVFNQIKETKNNQINIVFKDSHGFTLHRAIVSMDMDKSEVIGPNGKLIAFQFELIEDISKNIYSKIDHNKNEIRWTTSFDKDLDLIEENYF